MGASEALLTSAAQPGRRTLETDPPRYPWRRRLCGSKIRSGRVESRRKLLPLSGIEPQFSSCPGCSVVTVPNELSRSPFNAVRTETDHVASHLGAIPLPPIYINEYLGIYYVIRLYQSLGVTEVSVIGTA
jgi:hypothetical protein